MNDTLVKLDQVTFRYGERTVLDRCDLELHAGQRLGLVGANGSGKTTLLSLIVGLQHPQDGCVFVLGEARKTEADFRRIRGPVGLLGTTGLDKGQARRILRRRSQQGSSG